MVQTVLVLVEKLALFQQFICRGALRHANKLFYEKSFFIQKHTIEPRGGDGLWKKQSLA